MAIYVKGKKIEETDEHVMYLYGKGPGNLEDKLKIYKDPLDWEIIVNGNEVRFDWFASLIAGKICMFEKENGFYPDEISKQS